MEEMKVMGLHVHEFCRMSSLYTTDWRLFLQALDKWKFIIYTSNTHIWICEYLYFVYKIINCIFV